LEDRAQINIEDWEKQKKYLIDFDPNVPKILGDLEIVIAISTYQLGKVIFVGSRNNNIVQVPISFKKPMGIAVDGDRLAVATLDEIHIFKNSSQLAKNFPYSNNSFDKLYLPRAVYFCGETDLHDISFGKGGIWAVNTKFSCLATINVDYSFSPKWKPPFISSLVPEDRCHLNGMAMKDGLPAYVTALSQSDNADGWRENITKSGVLMEVPSGKIILDNLAIPHSPRIYKENIYIVLSASGEVLKFNPKTKESKIIKKIDGFIRGMTIYKNYMFIGLSKVREASKTFSKLPTSTMTKNAGMIILNLENNQIEGRLTYKTKVEEIYDVQLIPNTSIVGLLNSSDEKHKNAISIKGNSFWKKDISKNDN